MENSDCEKRRFERYTKRGWRRLAGMKSLRKGDRFRVFEPDGTPHVAIAGRTEFIAISNPYQINRSLREDDSCTWTIECEAVASTTNGAPAKK